MRVGKRYEFFFFFFLRYEFLMNLGILNIFAGLVLCFESLLYKNPVLKNLVKTREEKEIIR